MANRKAAEAFILEFYDALAPGNKNTESMRVMMAAMTDEKFDDWMKALEDGSEQLTYLAPNNVKPTLNVARNIEIGKKYFNHSFFERIWLVNDETSQEYLTPHKYMVIDLPLRRQAQALVKKTSIPENNKQVDNLTGQPTGTSRGGALTFPEVQVMAALDLPSSITELMKYRGGDQKGFHAMNDSISKTGGVSQKAIEPRSGSVKSTQTFSAILTAMHLENNLVK